MSGVPAAQGPYARLLATPAYARVLSAGLGSTLGSAISAICLVWIVYTETGSALDVALLGIAWMAAAILFSIFGGTLVDRYDRRRLMIVSDVARAVAMGVVVVVQELHGFDLLTVLGAYFVVGAFTVVFNPAEQAIVPVLVDTSLVADANGLVRSSRSAAQFVGTSLGGALIVTLGALVGIAANAVTFAVSAALILGMSVPAASGPGRSGRSSYIADVREGFRWLGKATGLLQLTISATFFNFCGALIGTFIVVFATVVLHGSAVVFAVLLAVEVAGNGIGSLLVSRTQGVRYAGRSWTVGAGAASGAAAIALALFPSVPVAVACLFLIGVFGGYAVTAWLTAAQLLVPSEMQGRYFGIDAFGSIAIIPAAQIGGAFLIDAYGVQPTYLWVAVLWFITGLVFLLPKALQDVGYPQSENAPVTPRSDAASTGTSESHGGTRAA